MPGFGELMRKVSLEKVPTAILSRQTAGIRGRTLIVNLPGQPRAIAECLDAVFPGDPLLHRPLGRPIPDDRRIEARCLPAEEVTRRRVHADGRHSLAYKVQLTSVTVSGDFMQASTFQLETPDGVSLFVYRWLPEQPTKAVVQIAHGWAEHAGRYARVKL